MSSLEAPFSSYLVSGHLVPLRESSGGRPDHHQVLLLTFSNSLLRGNNSNSASVHGLCDFRHCSSQEDTMSRTDLLANGSHKGSWKRRS